MQQPEIRGIRVEGPVLRSLRTELGLSQNGLATRVGVSQPRIAQIEASAAVGVRPALFDALVTVLGAEPREPAAVAA